MNYIADQRKLTTMVSSRVIGLNHRIYTCACSGGDGVSCKNGLDPYGFGCE